MLLQAAGNVSYLTRTCFSGNLCKEGEASSSSRHGCASSKKHQRGRGTHCYLSSNAHFAHQYDNHFTCFCKTHARRHALCHRMEVHRIPIGLHQARKHSLRKTVAVTAVKTPSNQDTSQQGEASKQGASTLYKTAMVSAKGVKVEGVEHKAHLLNTDTASSEKVDSEALASRKLTRQLTGRIKNLINWWKALHEVYQEDSAMWGYGSSPIFTVYKGPDSKIEKVLINEKEIQRRQGVEPLLAGLGDDESKARAEQKIMQAQIIAKDLEMGKMDLDSRSMIFTVVKQPSKVENQTSRQKLLSQIDFAVHKAAPVLRSGFMIAIPLYGIYILFGAYLLVTKPSEEDISKEEKSAASLEKMRKLKAQMNTHKESAAVGQATLAPSDFMQKLLEVREMARKVRSEEGLQKSVKDSETYVEEYEPQEQSALNKSISMVENDVGIKQGGIGHQSMVENDVIDTTVIESSVSTMDNMGVIKSNNNVIDDTVKPPPKVKPRIITSLDEAMAVIGSKQTVIPNGIKSNPDLHGTTAERALSERETQAEHESGIANMVHYDNLTASLNGLNNSQSSVPETLPSKVDQIPSTSFGGQDRVGETQSTQSREIEVPESGVYLGPDKTDIETLDRLAAEGQTKEAQNFEPNFQRGSDDSQDSDKTASLQLLGENLENGQENEKQISSSARHSEVNNLAQKPFKNTPDQISGEVLPSTRSKTFLKKYSASKSLLNVDTDEVVGSGQPLRRRENRSTSSERMTNTKRWSKELQRKYDLERDPETRELMKEIGSELDSWVTEEEVESSAMLASKLEEIDDDVIHKHYEKVQKKMKDEKEKFGLEAVLEKYKEYQPKPEDDLWWLDLHSVLCLMVVSAKQEGGGLYGLDMTIDSEGMSNQVARHLIAFEDRKDASNFCRLLELRSGSRFQFAQVCPFSPKKLFEVAKEEGFKVTVLRNGQIQTNVDQTLEEVEEQILEIGRSVYWEKMDRDRSIDIDSILHQRFGL